MVKAGTNLMFRNTTWYSYILLEASVNSQKMYVIFYLVELVRGNRLSDHAIVEVLKYALTQFG